MSDDFDENLSTGYHGIPDAAKREKMSVLELAEEMVKHQKEPKDSAAYVVLSHELNLKLAKEQANLNYRIAKFSAAFAVIGAIAGAAATDFFASQQPPVSQHCKTAQNCSAHCATQPSTIINNNHVLGSPPTVSKTAPSQPEGKQNNAK